MLTVSFVALSDRGALQNMPEMDQQVQRAERDSLKSNPTLQEQIRNIDLLKINAQFRIF
jgi:hypothetical protein